MVVGRWDFPQLREVAQRQVGLGVLGQAGDDRAGPAQLGVERSAPTRIAILASQSQTRKMMTPPMVP